MYANRLIWYFHQGLLTIPQGTMLRLYLSDRLHCEPMRITKKFKGPRNCVGKQFYAPHSAQSTMVQQMKTAKEDLIQLRRKFLQVLGVHPSNTGMEFNNSSTLEQDDASFNVDVDIDIDLAILTCREEKTLELGTEHINPSDILSSLRQKAGPTYLSARPAPVSTLLDHHHYHPAQNLTTPVSSTTTGYSSSPLLVPSISPTSTLEKQHSYLIVGRKEAGLTHTDSNQNYSHSSSSNASSSYHQRKGVKISKKMKFAAETIPSRYRSPYPLCNGIQAGFTCGSHRPSSNSSQSRLDRSAYPHERSSERASTTDNHRAETKHLTDFGIETATSLLLEFAKTK